MAKAAHCNCASRGFDSRPDFTRGAACRIRGHQGRGSVRCFSFWKVNGGSAAAPAANRMGRSSSVCGSCPPPSACLPKLRKRRRCDEYFWGTGKVKFAIGAASVSKTDGAGNGLGFESSAFRFSLGSFASDSVAPRYAVSFPPSLACFRGSGGLGIGRPRCL